MWPRREGMEMETDTQPQRGRRKRDGGKREEKKRGVGMESVVIFDIGELSG